LFACGYALAGENSTPPKPFANGSGGLTMIGNGTGSQVIQTAKTVEEGTNFQT